MPVATRRIEIGAPTEQVWELISAPGHLEECHPFCSSNQVEAWPGVGARDHLEYYNGRRIVRRFVGWEEGSGYDIEITDANGPLADVSWRISEQDNGSSLTIAITPRMSPRLPPPIRWVVVRTVVIPMLTRYLRSVLRGIEWRVTTGRPVKRNQFGRHRWFSR